MTQAFLYTLYGDDALGHIVLWTRQDKRSWWVPATRLDKAAWIATKLAADRDVYFGVGLQHAPLGAWNRGTANSVIALPGLWADIDVQGQAHKATNLPPTKTAALNLVREFPLTPTIVVDSGYGVQPYWGFRELWILESEEERQQAQHLARCFLATMQASATANGWQIDPTADLARVLRVPGTFNRKLKPVPVRVIEVNEACRYNPSDFEPYLLEVPATDNTQPPLWHGPAGAVAPVLKHCRFLQHCRDDAATLSEPEWYAALSNLARLHEGREAVHELSKPYPQYSPAETDKKIDHALTAAGPHTCQYIQQVFGFTGCPVGGCGVKAPAGLGTSPRAIKKIEARERRLVLVAQAQERREQMQHRAAHARERLVLGLLGSFQEERSTEVRDGRTY